MNRVSLVIFTCEGREHLLSKTWKSFNAACGFKFDQVILAVDGVIDSTIMNLINPDQVIYGFKRKGYVISIKNTIINIKTEFFFWLEDDWAFHTHVDVPYYTSLLNQHTDWAGIVYSKYGPLTDDFKKEQLGQNLFLNINGYSTNPGFNRTALICEGFAAMDNSRKMEGEKETGFENFLTAYFNRRSVKYALIDPIEGIAISHEGYLESTPRNWHMISSLEKKTEKHLLIFPEPSMFRRLYMILKLIRAFCGLAFRQLWNNEVYEMCFRIIAISIATKQDERKTTSHHDSDR
ncbi:hypothetical protein SAMN05216464_103421 [Mucilaginibacter pineti]|uniref:Glycosyl transferase family 2 n=1 Tax=Mucilaginibacter pineti TaxID=1391627 RepID=A0A1G6ZPP6_9SPHI|nr:hypothetical protein [Mucilaginibacter pineti]SDE03815.1 hypothetical protein SAMN05216464_103421 [Mucilaginibacter pineti]